MSSAHDEPHDESVPVKKKARRSGGGTEGEKQMIEEFTLEHDESTGGRRKETSADEAGSRQLDELYASNLPTSFFYERSLMHRDVVTHLVVTKTSFLISGSQDGHIKFWKIITADYLKQQQTSVQMTKVADQQDKQANLVAGPIEFVKHFRAHLGQLSLLLAPIRKRDDRWFVVGPILNLCVNESGTLLCSTCSDRTLKLFDVLSFDMITMVKLDFVPSTSSFVHSSRHAHATLALADEQSARIFLFDAKNFNVREPLFLLDRLGHRSTVKFLLYSAKIDLVVSIDQSSLINYWSPADPSVPPSSLLFHSKLDTDLFELMRREMSVVAAEFSPSGSHFAVLARSTSEKKLFLFDTLRGKISKIFNEQMDVYKELHERLQKKEEAELTEENDETKKKKKSLLLLNNVEYSRRLTIEKEFERAELVSSLINLQFDSSGTFLFYSTLYGIKMLNLRTNAIRQFFGTTENARFARLALFEAQTLAEGSAYSTILFSSAFKKNRFYLFTRNNPADHRSEFENDRDVFNEKPSRDEILTATEEQALTTLSQSAILHTTMGDIHLRLFPEFAPKTCENFIQHAKQSYYNGCIFHRVIKQFMIQTGSISLSFPSPSV